MREQRLLVEPTVALRSHSEEHFVRQWPVLCLGLRFGARRVPRNSSSLHPTFLSSPGDHVRGLGTHRLRADGSRRDCEGPDARVEELAALDILDSRSGETTVARGFEEVDAGCWSDSGDVTVYAERTYAFPGTRAEVAAHYRTAAQQDGWSPDPDAAPDDLSFVKKTVSQQVVFLTAGLLAEEGHVSRPELNAGAGYSITVDSY